MIDNCIFVFLKINIVTFINIFEYYLPELFFRSKNILYTLPKMTKKSKN